MNNIQSAKEASEKTKALNALIVDPTPGAKAPRKPKLPLARDITLIETTLDKKLRDKQDILISEAYDDAINAYKIQVIEINTKALALKKEIESLDKRVRGETKELFHTEFPYSEAISDNPSDGGSNERFCIDMDDNVECTYGERFEKAGPRTPRMNELKKLIKESSDFVLNLRIGLVQMSDVKPLLEKINNI